MSYIVKLLIMSLLAFVLGGVLCQFSQMSLSALDILLSWYIKKLLVLSYKQPCFFFLSCNKNCNLDNPEIGTLITLVLTVIQRQGRYTLPSCVCLCSSHFCSALYSNLFHCVLYRGEKYLNEDTVKSAKGLV